jgi:hypothetical protein
MSVMTVLVSLGLLATMVSLAMGIGSMAQGGEHDRDHSVRLMFARVGLQGLTVALLLLALVHQFV